MLEYFLIKSSDHRVRHGNNPKYIDKNCGGIFVFWDKIFGTFQKEEEVVKSLITKSLASYT
jgi:alkylglycerol monooxygenase